MGDPSTLASLMITRLVVGRSLRPPRRRPPLRAQPRSLYALAAWMSSAGLTKTEIHAALTIPAQTAIGGRRKLSTTKNMHPRDSLLWMLAVYAGVDKASRLLNRLPHQPSPIPEMSGE